MTLAHPAPHRVVGTGRPNAPAELPAQAPRPQEMPPPPEPPPTPDPPQEVPAPELTPPGAPSIAPTTARAPAKALGVAGRLVRRPLFWLGVVGVVALAAYGVVAARGPLVHTVIVTRQDLEQHLVASGRVWVPSRIQITSQASGLILSVPVKEGDRVRVGELLVQMDEQEARAAVGQARAGVSQARARLEQLRQVSRVSAAAGVSEARTALERAETALGRAVNLSAAGAITRAELEEAHRLTAIARAQAATARAEQRASAPNGAEAEAAVAAVQQALAAEEAAQARLAQRRLVAPRDAIVLTRAVEPGDLVQPTRTLLVLAASADASELVFQSDERNLAVLRRGQKAVASADAYPEQRFAAELTYLAPSIDPERGSIEVRLSIPNPPAFLKPDMTVSIDLTVATRPQVLTLCADAVHGATSRAPWLLTVEDAHVVRKEVTLGIRGEGTLELVSGATEGTAVVLPDGSALTVGQRVRARPEAR